MSVYGAKAIRGLNHKVARLSTVHGSVIRIEDQFARFPSMGVPSVTESSFVVSYPRGRVELRSSLPSAVASGLRRVKDPSEVSRFVASAYRVPASVVSAYRVPAYQLPASVASAYRVPEFVASAFVSTRSVASLVTGVSSSRVASASSPRVALAPALQLLRRAALAKKCSRIAGRLASFAGGQPRQSLQ